MFCHSVIFLCLFGTASSMVFVFHSFCLACQRIGWVTCVPFFYNPVCFYHGLFGVCVCFFFQHQKFFFLLFFFNNLPCIVYMSQHNQNLLALFVFTTATRSRAHTFQAHIQNIRYKNFVFVFDICIN